MRRRIEVCFLFLMVSVAGCGLAVPHIALKPMPDDEICKSYGLQAGTEAYSQCLLDLRKQHAAAQAQAGAQAAQADGVSQ
jgi:hypothetical protein